MLHLLREAVSLLLPLAPGVFLLYIGRLVYRRNRRLLRHGCRIQGTVTNLTPAPRGRYQAHPYEAEVTYQPASAAPLTARFPLTSKYAPGQRLALVCDPRQPTSVALAENVKPGAARLFWVLAACALLGGLLFDVYLR